MASAVPGPPDLISECPSVQPLDLVNSVQRPQVVRLDNNGVHGEQQQVVVGAMPVDIVGDLPGRGQEQQEQSPDVSEDAHDARWFSRGTGSNGAIAGEKHIEAFELDDCFMISKKRLMPPSLEK